jgi:Fic family protein
MVYHEIRAENGKKKNYLIYNRRSNGKWIKEAKFIGYGNISARAISDMTRNYQIEIIAGRKYPFLTKEQAAEIERLRQAYNEKIGKLSEEEFRQFERSFYTELTYNSNAIEGNTLSLEETSLILNENLVPEGKTVREVYEARNHAKALQFIKEYKGELTEMLILKLHSIILKDISERFAGKYRETDVRIFGSDARFPHSNAVPQLVRNMIYWYNREKKRCHPFELAAIASMKLVSIHPFVDGNGRVSRLIMNFILNKRKHPWVNVYNRQRARYLQAVRKANDEDYSAIIPFLISTLKENLRDFNIN